MRYVGANQYKVALHETRNVLTNVPYTRDGFYINQFEFRMVMPEKGIPQAGRKQFERLPWIW